MSQQIRILFLATQTEEGPSGYQERTSNAIQESIQGSTKRDRIHYEFLSVSEFPDITRAIIQGKPDVLHISSGSCSEEGLIMIDNRGIGQVIQISDLCELLSSIPKPPSCILFDTNESAVLAQQTAENGIFSIGMNGTIEVDDSQVFMLGFYEYLGNLGTLNVEAAFDQGKKYMWHKDSKEVPTLYRDPLLDQLDQLLRRIDQHMEGSCLIPHLLTHTLVEHPELVASPQEGLEVNQEFSDLEQAFEHNQRSLLLLGEAGSGKTISMMEFVKQKALAWTHDQGELFPLWLSISSWEPRQSISAWIEAESGIQPARLWQLQQSKQLLLILDSLDELPTDVPIQDSTILMRENHQRLFVDAWNKTPFLAETPCVLSSRIGEYEILTQHYEKHLLSLHGAVTLEPLRESSIREYLQKAHIPGSSSLIQILQADSKLLDLIRRPLFLEIVCNAYQDHDPMEAVSDGEQDLRHLVIQRYLEKNYQAIVGSGISLTQLKTVMGRAIFDLLADFHSGDFYLSDAMFLAQIADSRELPAYLQLAQDLHLLEPIARKQGVYRFRHLLMRDYLVTPFAIESLRSTQSQQRIRALVVLGKIGDTQITPLLEALHFDPNEEVRYELAHTLGRIRTEEGKLILKEYLHDEYPDVQMAAVRSLSRYGDPNLMGLLIRLIDNQDRDRFVRSEAIRAAVELSQSIPVSNFGDIETLRQTLNLIAGRDKFSEIREAANQALETIGVPAHLPPSQYLYEKLNSGDFRQHPDELSQLWMLAAHILTTFGFDYEEINQQPYLPSSFKQGGVLFINSLLRALAHPTAPLARRLAANALGKLGIEKAIDPLNTCMREDEFNFVREAAQAALTNIYHFPGVSTPGRVKIHQYMAAANLASQLSKIDVEYTPANDTLSENIEIFEDANQNDYERIRAAIRIAELAQGTEAPKAAKVLSQALDDAHPNVSAAAAIAMGRLGFEDVSQKEVAIQRLYENLHNKDHLVRTKVILALAKLTSDNMDNLDQVVEHFLMLWRNDPISEVRAQAEAGLIEIFQRTSNAKAYQALKRLGKLPKESESPIRSTP